MSYQDILAAVKQAGTKYNLPAQAQAYLMAIAETESNFNLAAKGPRIGIDVSGDPAHHGKRASGAFQFMPATAQAYKLSNPADPIQSADAAARHLLTAKKLQGDWLSAAIGHHSGPAWKKLGKYGLDYKTKLLNRVNKYLPQVSGTTPQAPQAPQGGNTMDPIRTALVQNLLGGSGNSLLGGNEQWGGGLLGQAGRALTTLDQPMIYGKQPIPNFGRAMQQERLLATREEDVRADRMLRTQALIDKLIGGTPAASTLEKQLQAAGLKPGTPEYQQAIMAYLQKSQGTSVEVNTGNAPTGPTAPEGGNWVKEGDASKGYYTMDTSGTPSAIKYLPGTDKPTAEERKAEAQVATEKDMLSDISSFATSNKADKLFDVSGKVTDFMRGSGFTPAMIRTFTPDILMKGAGIDPNDPDIAGVMSSIASLRTVMLNRISGAAVSDAEAERMLDQLPTPGQSKEVFEQNIRRTTKNLEILEGMQQANRGNLGPVASGSLAGESSGPGPKTRSAEEISKAWGL